ncbi:MAG: choice-of-anchor D domain-containing protein [Verrucomicrobia bacterium]|nr:choice-of-anchor D domain-containing protein [Verrucomicrobiota bacterium]
MRYRFLVGVKRVGRVPTLIVSALLGLLPLEAGLIGFYSFDDPADPYKDDSGNFYTLEGGYADPVYVPDGGVQGGAFLFNGTQRLVAPIDINTYALPALTMGAWVRTSSLVAGQRKVMGHDNGGYDRTLGLDTRNGGFRYTAFIGTGDPPPGSVPPKSTSDWTFLAVTYDDWTGQMTVYVDLNSLSIGDPLEMATSPAAFGDGQATVAIGGLRPDNADEGWQGAIDNVFFYDEVLTVEQLTAIRDGGKGAILGSGAEDPDLRLTSEPQLRNLPKSPPVLSFTYGVRNIGPAQSLTLSSVKVAGADAARYRVVDFPSSLAPGASGEIRFTLDSQGRVGAFTAMLEIESNDPSQPLLSLDISAQVGDDPDLVFTAAPNLLDLAQLPPVQTLTFEIRNAGLFDTLKIQSIMLSGPDVDSYSVKSFPTTLAPGATGVIEFTFDRHGQVGSFAASARIESNDASTPVIDLDVSARVTGTALLAFYSFDDEAEPRKDDSGNNRTLQSAGEGFDPTYDPVGGVAGGGYDFDGGQRWVVPLNINPDQIPVLTMGAWVRTSAISPGLYKVIGHDNGGWDRGIGLDNRTTVAGGPMPNGTYRYVAFTGTNNHGPSQGDPAPEPLGPDAWTFLAAVYDQPNKQLTLYVDLDVATTHDEPQAIVHAAPMGAGATTTAIGAIAPGGGEGWVGPIDNVFFLGGRTDAALVRSVRDLGKEALLQLRPDPVLVAPSDPVFATPIPIPVPQTVSVELRNTGQTQPLAITEARIIGRNAAHYAVAEVPAAIAPGASAAMKVTFDPRRHEGQFESKLDLISNSTTDRHTLLDLSAFVPYESPLIAFYPFDDPANPLRNATGKGSDLIVPAGAAPAYQAAGGIEGGAYVFSGQQRLIAPISINPGDLPQLTMGAWVKASSLVPGLRKIMGHDNGGYDRSIGFDTRNGSFRFTAFTGSGLVPDTPVPVSTEAWSFVAITYDQENQTLAFYVDPDVATTDDPLTVVVSPTVFGPGFTTTAIGGLRPDNADEGWQGSIDNVFFYQTVLDVDALTRIRDKGAEAIVPRPDDPPQITEVRRGADLKIAWSSIEGRIYTVEHTAALPGGWASIATVPSHGSATSYTDTDPTRLGKAVGFYRVQLQP